MEKLLYKKFNLEIYQDLFQKTLRVIAIPMPGFKKVFAGLYVGIGGFEKVEMIGKTKVPAGIAHFLEHKMFALENGQDAATILTQMGAQANAYTSFNGTVYYFSTTKDFKEPLYLIFKMTESLELTEADVEKEKGIILQELAATKDSPSDIIERGLVSCLYEGSPLRQEILGDANSIKGTFLPILKKVFQHSYSYDNKALIVVGNFSINDLEEYLKSVTFNDVKKLTEKITSVTYKENYGKNVFKEGSSSLPLASDFLGLGFKLPPLEELYQRYQDNIYPLLEFIPELLSSHSSSLTQYLLDRHAIIGGAHSYFVEAGPDTMLVYEAETLDYLKLKELLLKEKATLSKRIKKSDFNRVKKSLLGKHVRALASPSDVFYEMLACFENRITFPDLIEKMNKITYKELKRFLDDISLAPSAYYHLKGTAK